MYTDFLLFHLIRILALLSVLVGGVLFLAYLIRHLNPARLKKWGLGLLVGGLAVSALGAAWGGMFGPSHMRNPSGRGAMMMRDGDETYGHMMMKPLEDGYEDDDDASSMTMNAMSDSLQGLSGDDFDKAFIQMMIPHHQGAIDMARQAEASAKHQEIKDLAKAIISGQSAEIGKMQQWMDSWGYAQ